MVDVTPVLPARDLDEAKDFYTRAGFEVRTHGDGGYAFVTLDDDSVFDLGVEEGFVTTSARAGCYLIVPDVDRWHDILGSDGFAVGPLADQDYGMREFSLRDPSGNTLRFGSRIG